MEKAGYLIRYFDNCRSPSFHVEWNVIKYPFQHINTRFQPVSSRGAIVTKYIRSGQIAAVAMNQNRPALTSLLFVSPLTDTVMVSSLKGCGVKDKRSLRGRYEIICMNACYPLFSVQLSVSFSHFYLLQNHWANLKPNLAQGILW